MRRAELRNCGIESSLRLISWSKMNIITKNKFSVLMGKQYFKDPSLGAYCVQMILPKLVIFSPHPPFKMSPYFFISPLATLESYYLKRFQEKQKLSTTTAFHLFLLSFNLMMKSFILLDSSQLISLVTWKVASRTCLQGNEKVKLWANFFFKKGRAAVGFFILLWNDTTMITLNNVFASFSELWKWTYESSRCRRELKFRWRCIGLFS